MKFACYQGIGKESIAIRWLTRSDYSHVALEMRNGDVIEAWTSGVRLVKSLSQQHTPGTVVDVFSYGEPLSAAQEAKAENFLYDQLGKKYDFIGVLRFITRRPATDEGRWFCSELATEVAGAVGRPLFFNTKSWEVPPGWVPRSLALKFDRRIVTD